MEKLSSVEGYIARAATGLLAGLNASKQILGKKPLIFPAETMLGALCAEIFDSCKPNFKPLKESYGILPPLGGDNLRRKDRHLKLYTKGTKKYLIAFLLPKKLKIKIFPYIIILAFMISSCSHPVFDGDRAFRYLSQQVAFGYRIPGSQASKETSIFIQRILDENGWSVDFQEFVFEGVVFRNIVAYKNKSNPEIIIGTHYDTRQISDQELDVTNQIIPVLGANDGASGTAVLLELSHHLVTNSRNIWLVFFDGEDQGRINNWPWSIGAEYFATNLENHPEKVLIVDMVGDKDLKVFKEKNSSKEISDDIWSAANQAGYGDSFINQYKYSLIDDHLPFINRGIPAALLIDFDYPFWHTNSDVLENVSSDSLKIVGEVLIKWLEPSN